MVKEDFPDPETPVTTTNSFFGIARSIFFRLLALAPLIKISFVCFSSFYGEKNAKKIQNGVSI